MDRRKLEVWLAQDPLFQRLRSSVQVAQVETWLVGGTVRDLLLGREVCDIDLAVQTGALALGRRLAHDLSAAFYPLDAVRGVGRVMLPGTGIHIDLADLRAPGIEADLRARDFTINALAVPLAAPDLLLDLSGGLADLASGLLRAAGARTFYDDPLRILRLVRQGNALGFRLDEDTLALIPPALPLLADVSMERIRDEFLLVLAQPDASSALGLLHEQAVLGCLLPRMGFPTGSEFTVSSLQRLEVWLQPAAAWGNLESWRAPLAADWDTPLAADRPRKLMLKLAGLFINLPPDAGRVIGANLCLGLREQRHLADTLAAGQTLASGQVPLTPLERYLYFSGHGAAGLDGALLAAALGLPQAAQQPLEQLFSAWYTRYALEVAPPPLLSGDDLLAYGIPRGPRVGELLEMLRRAQVQGVVANSTQAAEYLQGLLRPTN